MTLTRARTVLLLATIVFLPRLLVAWSTGLAGNPEVWEYDVIGACIHAGLGHVYEINGLRYVAYAPPLWSFILAGLMSLPGESRAWIQVCQAILCLGTALAGVALGRRLSGRAEIGLVAGALIGLQPSMLYYSVAKSDPLPLNALLLMLIALSGLRQLEAPTGARGLLFGALVALGALSRGTPLVALPVLAVFMAARWRLQAVVPVLGAALTFSLGVAPWLIRNALLIGTPVLTSTTGENLWRGNNPRATGGAFDATGRSLSVASADASMFPPTIREALARGTERGRQDAFLREATRFMSEQPLQAAWLFLRKLRLLWWQLDSSPDDYWPGAAQTYDWIYRVELGLALFGGWTLLRRRGARAETARRSDVWFLVLLLAALSAFQALFYVQGRHRFLLEPQMLLFTTVGAAALVWRMRGENRRPC